MTNNASSSELNLRELRKLSFYKGFQDKLFPHKVYPDRLTGVITNEVNQSGWKYSNGVMQDLVNNVKSIYLDGALRQERAEGLRLNTIAGTLEDCVLLPYNGFYRVVLEVRLLETPAASVYRALASSQEWLDSHCFSLAGVGTVDENNIVNQLNGMRLYIEDNSKI